MDIEKLKAEYKAVLESAKTENRSLTVDEESKLDGIKAEINKFEAAKQIDKRDAELRSFAAVQTAVRDVADLNTFYRAITKGSNAVGNEMVIADIVRQYQEYSELFNAHRNVQFVSTGNTFNVMKVATTDVGAAKTEGSAGSADSDVTITPVVATFVVYSSDIITVSQEMLEDGAFDVGQEINAVGMAKSVLAFDAALVTAAETALGTYPKVGGTSWTVAKLVEAYLSLGSEFRRPNDVKWVCDAIEAAALIALYTNTNVGIFDAIGLKPENIIVNSTCTAAKAFVCNPTAAYAIGFKKPVRVVRLQTSIGETFEIQPRLAGVVRNTRAIKGMHRSV